MQRFSVVLLVVFVACSGSGWSQGDRDEFVQTCLESEIGDTSRPGFCSCWQVEIEAAGLSAEEFTDDTATNNDAAADAMVRCFS